MLFCRISRVARPAIAWKLPVQRCHDAVACHFCHNRRRSDRKAQRVTLNYRLPRAGHVARQQISINQCIIGRHGQPLQCPHHGQMAGAQNVHRINFLHRRMRDGNFRSFHNRIKQRFTALGGQGFAVGQTRWHPVRQQPHGGRCHGPCQRPPPHLIHPRNAGKALGQGCGFKFVIGCGFHAVNKSETDWNEKGPDVGWPQR